MPEKSAKLIFTESCASLMSHTIRGLVNHFAKQRIDVDIRIIADVANAIQLQGPNKGATSLLRTRLTKSTSPRDRDRVTAFIYLHQHANKHLARVCIAHEIYHLLMELNQYIKNKKTTWQRIEPNSQVEDQCNLFAWRLCYYHDKFNRDEALREQNVYFPKGIFNAPLTTNSTVHQYQWPKGIHLDPDNPFHQASPPSWL